MITKLIGGIIATFLGVTIIGPLSDEITSSVNEGMPAYNYSGFGITTLELVPGLFALGILGMGITFLYSSLREVGIF